MNTQLHSGFARTDITPPLGTLLMGYPVAGRKAETVRDRLNANALVLERNDVKAVLLSLDVCILDEVEVESIRKGAHERTGIPAQHITVCAIQTHSAPCTLDFWGWSEKDKPYIDLLLEKSIEAVVAANKSLQSGTLGIGVTQSEVGVNRREVREDHEVVLGVNPLGPYDPKMTVLRFQGTGGPAATLIHYGAHPTVLSGNSRVVSRDWPGVMIDRVEALTGAPAADALAGAIINQIFPSDRVRARQDWTRGRRVLQLLSFVCVIMLLHICGLTAGCGSDSALPVGSNPGSTIEDDDSRQPQPDATSLGWTTPRLVDGNPAVLQIDAQLQLTFDYGDSVFYRLSGAPPQAARGYMLRPFLERSFLVENRLFDLGGETKSLIYLSRDSRVVEVSEQGELIFGREGSTSVAVGVDSAYIDIPIHVRFIGLSRRMSKTEVTRQWDVADEIELINLDPGDAQTVNGKDYFNNVVGLELRIEQWFYESLPSGYVEFRGDASIEKSLWEVRTTHWESVLFSPIYPDFYLDL